MFFWFSAIRLGLIALYPDDRFSPSCATAVAEIHLFSPLVSRELIIYPKIPAHLRKPQGIAGQMFRIAANTLSDPVD